MPVEVTVRGGDEIAHVARLLRSIDDKELRKDFHAALNRATKPLKAAAQNNAAATLPSRGGLAALVASGSWRTSAKTGRDAGVRIAVKGKADLDALDRGTLRHPVFGNRGTWVTQQVTPGWFSKPMEAGAPEVRKELLAAIDEIVRRLVHG